MPANHPAQTAIICADGHIGGDTCDPQAIAVMLRTCELTQPRIIALNGDMLDCAELHKSTYNRRSVGRLTWQEECTILRRILEELRGRCPESQIVYLEGNHEFRFQRTLVEHAPHLASSVAPLSEHLGLAELGIEWVPCGTPYRLWDFIVIHQLRNGVNSARLSMLECGTNIAVGHGHRLAVIAQTPPQSGTRYGCAVGCLCSLGPVDYSPARRYPDWQQGFLELTLFTSTKAIPHLIPIVDRRAMYPGYSVSRSEVMVNELWQPMVDELAGSDRGRYEQLILG